MRPVSIRNAPPSTMYAVLSGTVSGSPSNS
jgi:hypothetical protein